MYFGLYPVAGLKWSGNIRPAHFINDRRPMLQSLTTNEEVNVTLLVPTFVPCNQYFMAACILNCFQCTVSVAGISIVEKRNSAFTYLRFECLHDSCVTCPTILT